MFHQTGTEGKSEADQGKNIVDAAKEAGIKFFIWTFVFDFVIFKASHANSLKLPPQSVENIWREIQKRFAF